MVRSPDQSSPAIRRLVLLGPSLLLSVLMFFHPSPYDRVEDELIPIATWWTVLHTLQFFLFAAMGASLWMLVAGLRGYPATTTRVAAVIFVLFYDIGDAVAGIATGLIASNAAGGDLPETAAVTTINSIFTDFAKDVFFGVGILAWIVALATAAVALWRAGYSRARVLLLAIPAFLLTFDHAFPYGTLTFASFFTVTLLLELLGRSNAQPRTVT